jgi:heme exporter protein CcmD
MSYVWAGYGVTVAALGGYTAWLLRRGRRLRKERG